MKKKETFKMTVSISKLFLFVIFLQWTHWSYGFVIRPRTNGILSTINSLSFSKPDSSVVFLDSKWKKSFEKKAKENPAVGKKVACRMKSVSSHQEGEKQNTSGTKPPRRQPKSQKMAIRWVVESISKEMNKECELFEKMNGKKKQPNFRLLEALTDLFKATDQSTITNAGRKIEALSINSTESFDVQERVMKAAAMSGLAQLSTNLLESMMRGYGSQKSYSSSNKPELYIPSSMAYSAVFNCLRKLGKITRMRNLLEELVTVAKKNDVRLDLVTFNIYLSGLCDTVVRSRSKYSQHNNNQNRITLTELVEYIQPEVASERFFLKEKPNLLSYNTILSTAARMGNVTYVNKVYSLLLSQGIQPDIYTYNARIRSIKSISRDSSLSEVLLVLDELLNDPNVKPDQYTVELVLVPLARAGRLGEILNLIKDFNIGGSSKNNVSKQLSNAFSTFLITLVKEDEIEIAYAIFDTFLLPKQESFMENENNLFRKLETENQFSGNSNPTLITRHFNTLIEGYKKIHVENRYKNYKNQEGSKQNTNSSKSVESRPDRRAIELFELMQNLGVPPDAYTITSILGVFTTSEEITRIWYHTLPDYDIKPTSIIYNAFITAYGNVNDPNSACDIFDAMLNDNSISNIKNSWNVMLTILSKNSSKKSSTVINMNKSQFSLGEENETNSRIIGNAVDGLSTIDATLKVLDIMRDPINYNIPSRFVSLCTPNSQSYCVVASALSWKDTVATEDISGLFENALSDSVPADGRFINALIRCFGERIEEAITFWKGGVRLAALSHENRRENSKVRSKKGKNLTAAYHGLFNVAGRAERPDIALRLAYAMVKEGLEPTETTLNSYQNGKRIRASTRKESSNNFFAGSLTKQYESLLTIECTKYDKNDRRRSDERRVKIII